MRSATRRVGAQRRGGLLEAGVRGPQRTFHRDDEERHRDERLRDDDGGRAEREGQPRQRRELPPHQAAAPEGEEQGESADDRRQHERQRHDAPQHGDGGTAAQREQPGQRDAEDAPTAPWPPSSTPARGGARRARPVRSARPAGGVHVDLVQRAPRAAAPGTPPRSPRRARAATAGPVRSAAALPVAPGRLHGCASRCGFAAGFTVLASRRWLHGAWKPASVSSALAGADSTYCTKAFASSAFADPLRAAMGYVVARLTSGGIRTPRTLSPAALTSVT